MVVLKVNMKRNKFALVGLGALLLTSCSTPSTNYEELDVLCVMSGYEGESNYQNDLYRELINSNINNKYNIKFTLEDLGNDASLYDYKFKDEVTYKAYDYIVIFGDDLSMYTESTIKIYQGYKFVYFDNESNEKYDNTTSFNFTPEEFGALAARKIEEKNSNTVSYFYKYQNSYYDRKFYGLFNNLTNDSLKLIPYNIEEKLNEDKVKYYVDSAKEKYNTNVFFEDSKSNYDAISEKVNEENLITSTYMDNIESKSSYIYKDYRKMFDFMLKNMAEKTIDFSSNYELGINDGFLKAKDVNTESLNLSKFDFSNYENLDTKKEKYFVDIAADYDARNSVYGKFHEAVPNCNDTNDWKYAPRPGGDDGKKPVDWKALGIWSTIYAQDGMRRVNNTGIEFQNMKIYGYSKRRGWVFLEHANPVGSFYDEDFVDDYHTNFEDKYFNNKEDKKTRILLDKNTYGFNYHPFGNQIDLEEKDLVDIEYVYSTMEIRLITWDKEKPSDINDAKYVANIGGDWWVYKGATWKPDWSANKDVSVGQFRTITKDWKTLEMCSVPLDKFDEIVSNKEFLI